MGIRRVTVLAVLLGGLVAVQAGGLPASAQEEQQESQGSTEGVDEAARKKEERQRWRQEQIDKLHERQAEKRAAKERREAEKQAAREAEAEQQAALEAERAQAPVEPRAEETPGPGSRRGRAAAGAAAGAAAAGEGERRRPGRSGRGGGDLAVAQARVRASPYGQEPLVQEYLDLFDRDEASTAHYATFANFLAQNGWFEEAIIYYRAAIRREPDNPLLWLNVGTLEAQREDHGAAIEAFGRALQIAPNNALAHYNRGVSMQALNRYEEAVSEFEVALRLDPSLADPEVNPQAVNNRLLLAVKLRLYQTQVGAAGLPLVDVPAEPQTDGSEADR